MELLTIAQATQKSGLSDKTLRRAIESSALKVQPKLYSNSKIMISASDLDAYIASRQPVSSDVQAPDIQEHLSAMQQQIDTLMNRVSELEKMVFSPVPESTVNGHVQTVSKQPRTRAKKQNEPVFEIADFSQGYQNEYKCRVTCGDVFATLTVSPYIDELIPNEPDIYSIYRFDWHPVKKVRNPSEDMRIRGIELKEKLYKAVVDDMLSHGWTAIREGIAGKMIYRKANT